MSIQATRNVATLLRLQLADGDSGKFPQGEVYDSSGSLISTIDLIHQANGLYQAPVTFTSVGEFDVVFITYNNAGHTVESGRHKRTADAYTVTEQVALSSEVAAVPANVDAVLTAAHGAGSWQSATLTGLQAAIDRIEGLVGNNHVIEVLEKNANGDATRQRIRHYDTEDNAQDDDGATGLLNTYIAEASYDIENSLDKYTITRVGS